MPWRNGLYVRLQSWAARAAAGAPISAVEFDADGNDEATALDNCILRDGTGVPTADLPMAGHSLTGIRKAVAAGEPVEFSQLASAGGTAANKLHNASFLVNQRAVSGTIAPAAGAYAHDRWKAGAGGCSYTIGAVGADVQATIASGSLLQIIAGSDIDTATMTVSNAGSAQGRLYASGGTPPGFQTCPFTVSNLTPGASAILEWATGTVLQPQVEAGATAHAFARRPVALDLFLCQSYYETFFIDMGGYTNANVLRFQYRYRSQKISVPTVTVTKTFDPFNCTVNTEGSNVDSITVTALPPGNYALINGTLTASCEP